MKTFRAYLLSYLGTLFLPIIVLSAVIFQIISQYSSTQIIERNQMALEQLRAAVAMQTTQLGAYALQTTQRSEFSERQLSQTASFYSIEQALTQWQMTNAFTDGIFFFASSQSKVYAYNAVYTLETFEQFKLARPEELLSGEGPAWRAEADGALFYSVSARVTTSARNYLICRVNTGMLEKLIGSAALYPDCSTYLCAADGSVLFASAPHFQYGAEDIARLISLREGSGTERLSGGAALYTKAESPANGLIFLNIVPLATANRPIARLWTIFTVGLLAIAGLGALVITLVMRVNYRPLRELGAMASHLGGEQTGDALHTVETALQSLHRTSMRTAALQKERVVLKLLLGSYMTREAFDAEANAAGLSLSGSRWRVVAVRGSKEAYGAENSAEKWIGALLSQLSTRPPYLEVPEMRTVVFVLSDQDGDAASRWRDWFAERDEAAEVAVSDACDTLPALAMAYAALHTPAPSHAEISAEISEALRNALEFGEPERICLTLSALAQALPAMQMGGRLLCYDILHLAQGYFERQGQEESARVVRMLLVPQLMGAQDDAAVRDMLDKLGRLLAERLTLNNQDGRHDFMGEILAYLSENHASPAFSVQGVADHFQLSISNLSHYFKNHTGLSVSEWVERLRIAAAKTRLRQTEDSVAAIAAAVGYAQPSSFMRAFKKAVGCTPSAYRAGKF